MLKNKTFAMSHIQLQDKTQMLTNKTFTMSYIQEVGKCDP